MKKFIIFFLMVFLYLGNSQARTEATLAKTTAGDIFSLAVDAVSATSASEYIIKNYDCSNGNVILSVGNPQPGEVYFWFDATSTLDSIDILHRGQQFVVNTNGTYVLGVWPGGIPTSLNPATQLASEEVTIYLPFTAKIVSITSGAANPYNIGIQGTSTISFKVEVPENPTLADFTYQWYLNGIPVANSDTVRGDSTHYTFPLRTGAGTYHVTVKATHRVTGCVATSTSWQVNVSSSIAVNIFGRSSACQGDVVTLHAQVDDGSTIAYRYQWLRNGNYLVGQNDPYGNFTFLADTFPGTSYFSVRITRDGCEITDSPEFAFVLEENHIEINPIIHRCPYVHATLVADYYSTMGNNPYKWAWFEITPSDTIALDTTYVNYIDVDTSGLYYVEAIFRGAVCGTVSDTINLDLSGYRAITGIVIETEQHSICSGGQIGILASILDEYGVKYVDTTFTYTWYKDGFIMPDARFARIYESYMAVDDDTTYHRYAASINIDGCDIPVYMDSVMILRNPLVIIDGLHHFCAEPLGSTIDNVALIAWVDGEANLGRFAWYVNGQRRVEIDPITFLPIDPFGWYYHEQWAGTTEPYNVIVEYQNAYGCSAFSAPHTFYVHTPPIVNITTPEDTICTPVDGLVIPKVLLTANLNDYNEDMYTYQWFNDSIANPAKLIDGATQSTYLAPIVAGENYFSVHLVQTNSGCKGNNRYMVYGTTPPVVDSITVDVDTVCRGRQVTFQAHISGGVTGGEVYTWYRDEVIIPNANQRIYIEYPQTDDNDVTTHIYNVVVTQHATACTSVLDPANNVTIVVKPNPTVVVEGDGIVCAEGHDNIKLRANVYPTTPAHGTYQYQWFEENRAIMPGGDADTLYVTKPYRDYPYNFHVIVSNDYGCSVESTVFPVLVMAAPVVTVTSTETLICEGGEVTMTANLNDYNMSMLTYQWYKDSIHASSLIAGATRSTYTTAVGATTTFFVQVDQLQSLCTTPASVTITVVPRPLIDTITLSVYEICEGRQVRVTAYIDPVQHGVTGSPYTYTWFRNGQLIEGVTGPSFDEAPFTFDQDNTYYIYSAYVTQLAAGCTSAEKAAAQLNVYRNPRPVIEGDLHICETDSVFLIANVDTTSRPVGTLHYTW